MKKEYLNLLGAIFGGKSLNMNLVENSEGLVNRFLLNNLIEAFITLSSKESLVLILRFGLTGHQAYTLKQVGILFGVTPERIRQIEANALRKLKHPSRIRRLRFLLKHD